MLRKTAGRFIGNQSSKEAAANLMHPPFSDRRFWIAQAMVAVVFLIHLGGDLAQDRTTFPVPGFAWILLLFVPVVYAGLTFGLVGSLGVALSGIVVQLPSELYLPHTATELWAAWSIYVILLITSIVLGLGFEESLAGAKTLAFAEALVEREEHFRLAFENNMAAMAVADLDGNNLWVNSSYCEMVGRSQEELVGRSFLEYTHPEDRAITEVINDRERLDYLDSQRYNKRFLHKNGGVILVEVSRSLVRDKAGNPTFLIASFRDITEERSLAEQLSHQALYDFLTGLPNRVLFQDRLPRALERTARQGNYTALFLMNLDDFRGVSNALGHHIGDQLLVALARRLEKITDPSGTLCRFRSDEFIYLVEGLGTAGDAEDIAESLLGALAEPFVVDGTTMEQTASIGVVVCDASNKINADTLLQNVFSALYEAKRQGKARYVIFTPDMGERILNRFKLAQELGHAISRNQLAMHYQPIVNLSTNEVVGFEALMRWQHPELGYVLPDVFIPLAEESDLIFKLGNFALFEAIAQAAAWGRIWPSDRLPYIAVNLSARQFHDQNLLTTIQSALASSRLSPSRLVVEITETTLLTDIDSAIRVIQQLKDMNVAVALDDFGTGYSSLSHLARLQPDIIKIDRSFVSSVRSNHLTERLLEAIVSLCQTLELTPLAEGIETQDQLAQLVNLGCEYGQGYLFSPAVPAGNVAKTHDLALRNWKE